MHGPVAVTGRCDKNIILSSSCTGYRDQCRKSKQYFVLKFQIVSGVISKSSAIFNIKWLKKRSVLFHMEIVFNRKVLVEKL